jgi:hypothetical protein
VSLGQVGGVVHDPARHRDYHYTLRWVKGTANREEKEINTAAAAPRG